MMSVNARTAPRPPYMSIGAKSLSRSRLPTQRVGCLALALVFVPMGPAGILQVLDAVTLNRAAADGDER